MQFMINIGTGMWKRNGRILKEKLNMLNRLKEKGQEADADLKLPSNYV